MRFGEGIPGRVVLIEFARTDLIPVVGDYNGRALLRPGAETFADQTALERAAEAGQVYTRTQAAGYLRGARGGFRAPAPLVSVGDEAGGEAEEGFVDVVASFPSDA